MQWRLWTGEQQLVGGCVAGVPMQAPFPPSLRFLISFTLPLYLNTSVYGLVFRVCYPLLITIQESIHFFFVSLSASLLFIHMSRYLQSCFPSLLSAFN